MYKTPGDIRRYLRGCVIRHKKTPVRIRDTDGMSLKVATLSSNKIYQIDANSEELDYSPVPLGYVNFGEEAQHIYRVPIRRWKQGLHDENINDADVLNSPPGRRALAQTILGKYPPLDAAVVHGNLAFHRDFAVMGGEFLVYRGNIAGNIHEGQPKLDDKHTYLIEKLEAAING